MVLLLASAWNAGMERDAKSAQIYRDTSTAWWCQGHPVLKNMTKVSWDDEQPKINGKNTKLMFQTTNQSTIGI